MTQTHFILNSKLVFIFLCQIYHDRLLTKEWEDNVTMSKICHNTKKVPRREHCRSKWRTSQNITNANLWNNHHFLRKTNNNLIRKPIKEINALNKASLRCFKWLINVSISGKNDLCSRISGYRREILSVML